MCKLTAKEEQVMSYFWQRGALFVREIVELHEEPRPHFNTISTIVRSLEERGYLQHDAFGNAFRYYAAISSDEFRQGKLTKIISQYYDNSYLGVVSSFVRQEKIPLDELKRLITQIENQ